ncbi:TonB-dependent receptor plug domain-containing protein [Sphingomonas flavalba]|uniref:TonB-dependent receptor plug domain-containing protein n=1 Tax=Sphingomonas flavalba TaxID=2559804 RepID=UPI0039E01BED
MGANRFTTGTVTVLLLAGTPAIAAPAAEPAAASGVLVFTPDFFAGSRPNDALDMIRRLPGFAIVDADAEVRGYAEAAGNILFDGKPPSTKAESLEDLLRRIPAAAVARIELIRGGAPGIAMGGRDVVANVVRATTASRHAAITAGAVAANDHVLRPVVTLEASRQSGARRIEGAIGITTEIDEDAGRGTTRTIDAAGVVTRQQPRRKWETVQTVAGRGAWDTPLAGGTLSTNASVSRARKREDVDTGAEAVRERETLTEGEAGAQYRHPIGADSRIEALVIRRIGRLRFDSTATEGSDSEHFTQRSDTAESIARLSLRRERGTLAIDAAIEGAINSADGSAALFANGAPVPVPGSNSRVEEQRVEASLGATWRPFARLTVEPALRLERSGLRQRGDAVLDRRFTYWKPRLALTRALGGGDQIRLAVQRDVGQLDFNDFVASASLDRGEINAGAVDLRPPRSWTVTATYEHRFAGDGAIVLRAAHERISDVVDHVVRHDQGVPFDAIGNIGRGSRDTLTAETTLPLTPLGMAGARIVSNVTLTRSRVDDPVTGARRWISGDKPVTGTISLIHDLPGGAISWGADMRMAELKREYRLDEIRTKARGFRFDAHVEYRPGPAWRLRLEAVNLTGLSFAETRRKYAGARSLAAPDKTETRRTATTPTVLFTVRRAFGG